MKRHGLLAVIGLSLTVFGLIACGTEIQSSTSTPDVTRPIIPSTPDWSKLQSFTFSGSGNKETPPYESIEATTSDAEPVVLEISIIYYISPALVRNVDLSTWPSYLEKTVVPVVKTTVGEVIAKYTALEIYGETRSDMQDDLMTELIAKLDAYSVLVQDVLVRDVIFTPEFELKTETDLVATQSAILTKKAVAQPSPAP